MSRADLNAICKDYGIKVTTFAEKIKLGELKPHMKKYGALAMMIGGRPLIIIDDTVSPLERRYAAAHELGHILLGHLTFRSENGKLPQWAEEEARLFATVMVANDLICRYGAKGG